MENNTKKNQNLHDTNSHENNKKYPGNAPENEEGNTSDAEKEEQLAESGPVRNPNYHDMDDQTVSSNRYRKDTHNHPGGTDGKTLEDFNDTEPKRDINKAPNNETKDHIKE
jgi:hypothetical protein